MNVLSGSLWLVLGCNTKDERTGDGPDPWHLAEFEYPACERDQPWIDVAPSATLTCGVRANGCAECWGNVSYANETDTGPYIDFDADEPPAEAFRDIELVSFECCGWSHHGCGIRVDGTVTCWGRNDFGQADAPSGVFSHVAVGTFRSCGINASREIECWGLDGEEGVADGEFADVVGVSYDWLALDTAGLLHAWGRDDTPYQVPNESFSTFDATLYGCGIRRSDSQLSCWSSSGSDAPAPILDDAPAGRFRDVCIVDLRSACALTEDGTPVCWGTDRYGATYPPDVTLTSLSCGPQHVCGLTPEGEIVCWGNNYYGQCDPPP